MKDLLKKIQENTASVAVLGLGYVGLPLAVQAALQGYLVFGVDTKCILIKRLLSGKSHIKGVYDRQLKAAQDIEKLKIYHLGDFISPKNKLECPDIFVVTVPTPLNRYKTPNLRPMSLAAKTINIFRKKYENKLFLTIVESTVYPGLTRELILEKMRKSSKKPAYVVYSPERLDPGNEFRQEAKKVIGSENRDAIALARAFFEKLFKNVFTCDTLEEAEAVKVLENAYRFLSCLFANKVAEECQKREMDAWSILRWTKRDFGELPEYLMKIAKFVIDFKSLTFRSIISFLGLDPNHLVERCVECRFSKVLEKDKLITLDNSFSDLNIHYARVGDCFRCMTAIYIANMLSYLKFDHINESRVLEGISTKPYGLGVCYPGPGVGGHCIPIDPMYLLWRAEQLKLEWPTLQQCFEYNSKILPRYIVNLVNSSITKYGLNAKECFFIILGVSYKKNVPDIRSTPSYKIILELVRELRSPKKIYYFDPVFDEYSAKILGPKSFTIIESNIKISGLSEAAFRGLVNSDINSCILILCDHDDFNKSNGAYDWLSNSNSNSCVTIDLVGAFERNKLSSPKKLFIWGGNG